MITRGTGSVLPPRPTPPAPPRPASPGNPRSDFAARQHRCEAVKKGGGRSRGCGTAPCLHLVEPEHRRRRRRRRRRLCIREGHSPARPNTCRLTAAAEGDPKGSTAGSHDSPAARINGSRPAASNNFAPCSAACSPAARVGAPSSAAAAAAAASASRQASAASAAAAASAFFARMCWYAAST